ncbi:hypothetical protein [Tenacibaculum sp. M341]|nr:hypothetical protein [Tenacibaculum sp. M341]
MTDLERDIIYYFKNENDNRISVIAEKYNTSKYIVSRVVNKHLSGKFKS